MFFFDTKGSKAKAEESSCDSSSDLHSDSDSDEDKKIPKKNKDKDSSKKKGGKQRSDQLLAKEAEIKAAKVPRRERRELILQARQREAIAKKLGIDVSDSKVEKALKVWVEKRTEMLQKVEERRKIRQQKKAARRSRKMKEKTQLKKEKAKKKAEAAAGSS